MAKRSINLTDAEQKAILNGEVPASLIKKVKTAQKPKSTRYGKNKGAGFQKQMAQVIADLLEMEWDNQDDDSPIATRSMGLNGVDIILRGEAKKRFPFDIECKAVESLSVPATIEQAKANKTPDRDWLIFWKKKSFDEPVAIMSLSAFLNLFKKTS